MLRNPSLLVQPTSGFVPFSTGATVAGDLDQAPARRVDVLHPGIAPARIERRQAVWEPATAARSRRVEAAVLVAICGYFTFGLGKLLLGAF